MSGKIFLLAFTALFLTTALPAQQTGTISAQQVMTTLAGMRSDLSLALEADKRLSLRLEALEEALQKKDSQIRDLQELCNMLTQQNQSLETRILEMQKALEAEKQMWKKELQDLSKDLKTIAAPPAGNNTPQPQNTIDLPVKAGDTLSSIAKAAGCTVQQIMAVNPQIKSADELRVGQIIHIPVK